MLTVDQTLAAIEAGEPVPGRAARIAVAVIRHAFAELATGVDKAIDEGRLDDGALSRLGGYLYESELMLRDPVILYPPAGGMLDAFLAREKFSEAAS